MREEHGHGRGPREAVVAVARAVVFERGDDLPLEHDLERELGDALRSFNRALSDADLADIIESVDSDGTGTIEFPEFLDIVRPQNATEDAFLDAGS